MLKTDHIIYQLSMLRTLFTFVVISLISFSGYSNPISSTKNDSVVVQRNNVGVAEGAAEDVFEFLDVKDLYCNEESVILNIKLKNNTPDNLLKYLYVADEAGSYRAAESTTNKFEFKISRNYYSSSANTTHFFIITPDSKYKSESSKFTLITSIINSVTDSHCEGFSSKLEYNSKSPFESISWEINNKKIEGENSLSFYARDGGEYKATITYKGCTTKSLGQTITLNSVPDLKLLYVLNNAVCNGSSIPIGIEIDSKKQDFPFTEYHLELDGKVIEKSKEKFFSAKQSGLYYVTAYQGNCSSKSDSLRIFQKSAIPNDIAFYNLDTLITNSKLTTCEGQKIRLYRNNEFINGHYSYETGTGDYNDSLLNAYGISFQWFQNGKSLEGANKNWLESDQQGRFILQMKQGNCITNSNPLEISHAKTVPMKLWTKDNLKCLGQKAAIYFRSSGDYGFFNTSEVSLYKDGKKVTNDPIRLLAPKYVEESGNYFITIKRDANCVVMSDTIRLDFQNSNIVLPTDTIYSSSEKIKLSAYNPTNDSRFTWKYNNEALQNTQTFLEIEKSGLYTSENTNGCKTLKKYQVLLKQIKVELTATHEYPSFCEGREITLKAILGHYNKFDKLLNIKLLKNGKLITIKQAKNYYIRTDRVFPYVQIVDFSISEDGLYSVEVDENDCETISSPIQISFKKINVPIVSDLNSITNCLNRIKVSSSHEDNIQWFLNDNAIHNFSTEIIPSSSGVYYAKVNRGDCVNLSEKKWVDPGTSFPVSAAISGDTLVNAASTVNLNLSFSGTPPFSYKLNNNDEGLASLNKHLHPVKVNSSSTFNLVSVRNACGEGTVSGSATIKVNVLAKEPSIGRHIRIFPVPTTGSVEIEFDQLNRHELSFQVINMSGQVIIIETKLSEPKKKLDLSHLSPGEYLIRMNVGKEVVTRKIIRQ